MDRAKKAKKIVIPAAIAVAMLGGATVLASSCGSKVETSADAGGGHGGAGGGSSSSGFGGFV